MSFWKAAERRRTPRRVRRITSIPYLSLLFCSVRPEDPRERVNGLAMLTRTLKYFALSLLATGKIVGGTEPQSLVKDPDRPMGTLEKMIVASGTVAMELDWNRLNRPGAPTDGPDW